MTDTPKRNRGPGFAGMDPERRRELARKGGQNAQAKGTAHRFSSEEAKEAGRRGGAAFAEKKRAERAAADEVTG